MGLVVKVDGEVQPSGISGTSGHIEPQEITMNDEMKERLWSVINENTELKQQLYMAEAKLEGIKRMLAE